MLSVNGEVIDEGLIGAEMQRMRPSFEEYVQARPLNEEQERTLREWSVENLIEQVLIGQAALSDPTLASEAEIDAAFEQAMKGRGEAAVDDAEIRADFARHYRLEKLLERIDGQAAAPTDEEIEAFYREHEANYTTPEMVQAAHIVKHLDAGDPDEFNLVKRQMDEVLAKLKKGENFEALALRSSDCPSNSGDLGWFYRGQMVERFEDVAFAMEPGQISEVFRTEFGYHIVKVNEKKAPGLVPLEQIKEGVGEDLKNQRKMAAMEKFLDELKAKAVIDRSE